jgi:hypothetical protein
MFACGNVMTDERRVLEWVVFTLIDLLPVLVVGLAVVACVAGLAVVATLVARA